MSRSIQVGDQVKVSLPPDHVIYTIDDIDQDGWIYIIYGEGYQMKQGILIHDGETKVLGSEHLPYSFEFIPRDELNNESKLPKFDDSVEGLIGDPYLDFQIIKNLDHQTLLDLDRSTSEYVRKLAYKGLIYIHYGDFVEDYGLDHNFQQAYVMLTQYEPTGSIMYGTRESELIFLDRLFKAENMVVMDYLFNKERIIPSQQTMAIIGKWALDWLNVNRKLDWIKDWRDVLKNNNLIAVKWLLDHDYQPDDRSLDEPSRNGLSSMMMLLDKYGYHPTVKNLHSALSHGHYHLADWMMGTGVEPENTSPIPLMMNNLDLAKQLSIKYNTIPKEDRLIYILNRTDIHNMCDILDWIIGFISEYPSFLPDGDRSFMIINAAMENNCADAVNRLLEMGYTPSTIGVGSIDKVLTYGQLETAKVLAKHGYKPSDEVLKAVRYRAFNEEKNFYPEIKPYYGSYGKPKPDDMRTYREIYDLFT